MSYEFDGWHATTAMAGAVQPARHQPDPAVVGGLGADVRHPRARRPEIGQAVPHAIDGVQHATTAWRILLTYGPNRDWLKNIAARGRRPNDALRQDVRADRSAGDAQGRGGTGGQRPVAADLRAAAVRAGGAADAPLVPHALRLTDEVTDQQSDERHRGKHGAQCGAAAGDEREVGQHQPQAGQQARRRPARGRSRSARRARRPARGGG